jgi:hypothetical protein
VLQDSLEFVLLQDGYAAYIYGVIAAHAVSDIHTARRLAPLFVMWVTIFVSPA